MPLPAYFLEILMGTQKSFRLKKDRRVTPFFSSTCPLSKSSIRMSAYASSSRVHFPLRCFRRACIEATAAAAAAAAVPVARTGWWTTPGGTAPGITVKEGVARTGPIFGAEDNGTFCCCGNRMLLLFTEIGGVGAAAMGTRGCFSMYAGGRVGP